MQRQEIVITRYGEMVDMINCLFIFKGYAEPKRIPYTITDYSSAIQMR